VLLPADFDALMVEMRAQAGALGITI